MANIYQFTISLFVDRNLPPDKRFEPHSNWVTALLSPIQYIQKFMYYFINGFTNVNSYSGIGSYSFGSFTYYQNKIYFRWKYEETPTVGIVPTNTSYWYYVMNGKYGMDVIKNWYSGRLCLELILNNYFNTTFRQPVLLPTRSDIYITIPDRGDKYFKIYDSEIGSPIYLNSSLVTTSGIYDGAEVAEQNYGFTINFPQVVYDAMPTDQQLDFVNSIIGNYIYAGIKYNIVSYV